MRSGKPHTYNHWKGNCVLEVEGLEWHIGHVCRQAPAYTSSCPATSVCYCEALKSVSICSKWDWVKWVFLKMFVMPLSPAMVLAQGCWANKQKCCSSVLRPTQLWRRLGKSPSPSSYLSALCTDNRQLADHPWEHPQVANAQIKFLVMVPHDSHDRIGQVWPHGRVWGHL